MASPSRASRDCGSGESSLPAGVICVGGVNARLMIGDWDALRSGVSIVGCGGDDEFASWAERASGGDLGAVHRLVSAHHARLRAIAERRLSGALRGRVDADDVLQLVYVDVVRRIGEFQEAGPGALFKWLCVILDSRIADAERRHRAAKRDVGREARGGGGAGGTGDVSAYDTLAAHLAVDSVTPSRVAAREEAVSLVMTALAGLSEEHRRVVELRFLKGMTSEEVGREMERTAAAVRMRSGRAMLELRRAVREIAGESGMGV